MNSNTQIPRASAFINDIVEVYRKHKLSLSHEDTQGGFLVCDYDEWMVDWILEAQDTTQETNP